MNKPKSKLKKKKLNDLDETAELESSDKDENACCDSNEESQEESSSDESDSSADSRSSGSSNVKTKKLLKMSKSNVLLYDSSESGDENSEKCAICLRSLTSQEVGNPEVCDHLFCSVCIIEWSKNSNVCPLDRQQFSIILVRKNKDGNVVKKVPVQDSQASRLDNLELEAMDDTVCEICGAGDREDIMLLCDDCDRGFHTTCLTPPLENIPDENEWFCPDCEFRATNGTEVNTANDILDSVSSVLRPLRSRVQMVRTRLLERIRVTVNRIFDNYLLQHSDEASGSEYLLEESEDSNDTADIEVSLNEPSTSGIRSSTRSKNKKGKSATPRKKGTKTKRKSTRKTTTKSRKKAKTSSKKKTVRTTKRKSIKRKARIKATRTKKVKVENSDGTITEKVIKTRTYKRRRKQKGRKKKIKTSAIPRRGLRVKSFTTPKTVKGRLALVLGMVPPKKPGKLLPEVKKKRSNNLSSMDLNRSRAGIPKLHIFGPRDELQYYSSDSDRDDFVVDGSGGVAAVAQQRTNTSRFRGHKKASLALHSPPRSTASKSDTVGETAPSEYVDILDNILASQAVWHSKDTNTNVKVNSDGSIEVIKNKDVNVPKPECDKTVDVRGETSEGMTTQAPMHPESSNRPAGLRPHNRNSYGESRNSQDNIFSSRSGQSQGGVNFNRFGDTARNDREGYANYLNSMPRGPAPLCRGGPPLRFRMPPRQQLRRIPFPPRNRPMWQPEDDDGENDNENDDRKSGGGDDKKEPAEKPRAKSQEEEDIDLYSDIESNVDKTDNSGPEDSGSNFPLLGPPPDPPTFLLNVDENGEFGEGERKSEVYDPAEPCDSEDEMVIDENDERASTPENKEPDEKKATSNSVVSPDSSGSRGNQKGTSDEEDGEDCPIFSVYSSATRKFSQREEEERQRKIAEDKSRMEKLKGEQKAAGKESESREETVGGICAGKIEEKVGEKIKQVGDTDSGNGDDEKKKQENEGNRSSFDIGSKGEGKALSLEENSLSTQSVKRDSRSRSNSVDDKKEVDRKSRTPESDKSEKSKSSSSSTRDKNSSPKKLVETYKRSRRKNKKIDSDSDEGRKKSGKSQKCDVGKTIVKAGNGYEEIEFAGKGDGESEGETVLNKVATGLEGLDVEEVSSENGDGDDFADKKSLSSLSLSELSQRSKRSKSPIQAKKKRKSRKRKVERTKDGKNYEEGEIDDSEKDSRSKASKKDKEEVVGNENSPKSCDKRRRRKSNSASSQRQILGSKENKKTCKEKTKEKDLSWKKPSKKDKNYREGKKRSNERGRSKSNDKRKGKSPSPKKDKKKNKDRKKKADKKKDIERYDVRKIVKKKEARKTDAFGRDIVSKSRSISRSRSRSPIRGRSRNMLRRNSRSRTRSRSRSFRRGRSPVRRRYFRSRTRSRSKSNRRSFSRSRSRSRGRKAKKKPKVKDRVKLKSRSRGRKSRSLSRGRRRSLSRSLSRKSRSPVSRLARSKKRTRSRKSWSHRGSRSPSFSPRRHRSVTRSPKLRLRRSSYSRSRSTSWSRGRSPLPRTSSLEKLTVVLTTKDKKKWKKKKEGKKSRKDEKRRKKTGNSKEVFASGDNVLVSVNFRNNNNATGTKSASTGEARNARLNSTSPVPGAETSRKKKRESDYETERLAKKAKKSNPISKKVVDVALSNACPKRSKKLTRLSEKDAEVILNRKPVAVIDLDMSPYREQTPSPVNVVVVSDSGSGDEGKDRSPQKSTKRATPGREPEKLQETAGNQAVAVSAPSSPAQNGYVPPSGPKTPPEPQIKFSINKPQQLRQIANPLGDDDEEEDDDEVDEAGREQRPESVDRKNEKESEGPHKGPNTPPAPKGPSTPKTPPSPQTSPDAYDPFEPTKSRSPSPERADKAKRTSPKSDNVDEKATGTADGDGLATAASNAETCERANEVVAETRDDRKENVEKCEAVPEVDGSSDVAASAQSSGPSVADVASSESPEGKVTVVATPPQSKTQPCKVYVPAVKQLPVSSAAGTTSTSSAAPTASCDAFSTPSPTKASRSSAGTTQSVQATGMQRLQHRLGSPVGRTPNAVKVTPRPESNDLFASGNHVVRSAGKRNGEQTKPARPSQEVIIETMDATPEMDDSPYSPASSEGDDLFDPPVEISQTKQTPSFKGGTTTTAAMTSSTTTTTTAATTTVTTTTTTTTTMMMTKASRKSPTKQPSKFDLLFGSTGPTLSPIKGGSRKANSKVGGKPSTTPKPLPCKPQKKNTAKKNLIHKMDEDQLRILDELPSSAVELQVKDKFLKKLNRQERVVDEVKTVLKPHYARKHITKEEYKDILRRSVPKICHSRSGEINPSKIQSLIEAYVKKFRHAKKKALNVMGKPKMKKTMFS